MTAISNVISRARTLVQPSAKQSKELDRVASSLLERTKKAATDYPEVEDVVLGGSYAKGTWLPDEADIDVFVRISPGVDTNRFESVGLSVGEAATMGHPRGKKYSQHPYIEANVRGVTVNIVPCYKVLARNWKSAADRSPFHVELIKERIGEPEKVEVRLLKKFMKTVGVYGAEIEREGFSGYVAEVLTLEHRTFEGVMKHFARSNIAPTQRLVLLDPVDEGRDLAKAISEEKVARLVLAARAFLRKPSASFFRRAKGRRRHGLDGDVVALVFTHDQLSEDILWGQLKRTAKHLRLHLEESGFRFARLLVSSNNETRSAFLFLPVFTSLPGLEERVGPSALMEKEQASFVKKNGRKSALMWVFDDGRIHLLQRRKQTELVGFLATLLRSRINEIGGSPNIARSIARTGAILSGKTLRRRKRSEPWLLNGLDEIVSDTFGISPD